MTKTKRLALFFIVAISLVQGGWTASAQKSEVDIFAGVDFKYRSIMLNDKMYEFLINVTPAAKWRFGNDWQIAAQAFIPIVNNFGDYYKNPRINVASISKEVSFGNNFFKLSGGLFSKERFGVDLKWLWTTTSWFALEGQVGVTGYYTMATDWQFSEMNRLTGLLTARFYLQDSDTEFRLSGGRYNYGDYGGRLEWLKHFRYISVSVFGQYGDRYGEIYEMDGTRETKHFGGGAKLIVMLPLQGKAERSHVVRLRPASNFRVTYDYWADINAMQTYMTDPEENERTGNFTNVKWGISR